MPRVTVIIPTYNYAEVLPYSIGSVLRQGFADFELLVVGDGCTDASAAVVEGIAQEDGRVRWINLAPGTGHQSGPNNEGLRQARGEIVAYLGHDDLWMRNHLQLAVKAMDEGADLAYGLTELVPADGGRPTFAPQDVEYLPGIWIPPTAMAHRRDAATRAGGWKHFRDVPDRDPEADLWQRMHAMGCKVSFTGRLTAVKFSASARKGVYALKPTEEQALWSARIESEADFAEAELVKMLVKDNPATKRIAEAVGDFARDMAGRARRRLGGAKKQTRAEVYEERLRFKGADRNG